MKLLVRLFRNDRFFRYSFVVVCCVCISNQVANRILLPTTTVKCFELSDLKKLTILFRKVQNFFKTIGKGKQQKVSRVVFANKTFP